MLLAAEPWILLALLLGAMLLDWLVGDPKFLWRALAHPVVLLGALIHLLDKRLNRIRYSDRSRGRLGLLTVLLVVGIALLSGIAVRFVALSFDYGWVAELLFVAILLAQRDLFDHVRRVQQALIAGGVAAGRIAVGAIVGRETSDLDAHAVARAAIESLAENFSDGVVAPIFWYLLLGPAGIAGYKAINTLDSMIGHKQPHYLHFGRAAAKLDDAANFLPARLTGALIALAAVAVPGARADRALAVMRRDAGQHRSPNAGWPEAAMAGALDLALSGPRRYDGELVQEPWIHQAGRARALPADIARALTLYVVACGVIATALLAALGWVV